MTPCPTHSSLLTACSIVLLSIATGCGGGDQAAGEAATSPDKPDPIRFTHATEQAGLGAFRHETGAAGDKWFPETVGGGAGFLDYDGDGWLDLVLVGGGAWVEHTTPALRLYRNDKDGTFTEVTDEAGLSGLRAYGMGLAVADYDNDGDPDIFLTTVGPNLLLRNDTGSEPGLTPLFVETGRETGLSDDDAWSTSALFFDADLDGFSDLYVGNYVDWSPENDIRCTMDGVSKAYCTPHLYRGIPGRFYHNNGDGTFSNRTESSGFLPAPGKTLGVAEWDINGDGWPDLVVANDTQRDLLYLNDGDGTFTEQGILSGIAFDDNGQARAGMGIDIGVVDDSERPSIVIGHFSKEMIGFYRQTDASIFVDRAAQVQVGRASLPTLTFGLCLLDVDVDGDLDLFVANGHIDSSIERSEPGSSYRQHPQLFLNAAGGRFSEVIPPIAGPMVARGAATADYDGDGDEDILVTENGGPVHLLRNDREVNHAIQIRLEGRTGNRDGLGAHLMAVAGNHRMHRRVRTGSSFLVSSTKTQTFGLGANAGLDSLTIRWPGDRMETFTDLPAGYRLHITEGEGITRKDPFTTITIASYQ